MTTNAKHWNDYVIKHGNGEDEPFVHPMAVVEGHVELGPQSSVWGGAVLRGDMSTIRLGRAVNIQDNSTLHVDSNGTVEVGDYTLVGHNVMLHGCRIGRGCLVGIGSVVLDGAEIGDGAMITAGCMIRGGKKIPPRALVVQKGGELKILKEAAKTDRSVAGCLEYIALARRFRAGVVGPFSPADEAEFLREAREIVAGMGI